MIQEAEGFPNCPAMCARLKGFSATSVVFTCWWFLKAGSTQGHLPHWAFNAWPKGTCQLTHATNNQTSQFSVFRSGAQVLHPLSLLPFSKDKSMLAFLGFLRSMTLLKMFITQWLWPQFPVIQHSVYLFVWLVFCFKAMCICGSVGFWIACSTQIDQKRALNSCELDFQVVVSWGCERWELNHLCQSRKDA